MIAFLRGKLAGKNLDTAYIDVNGIGYELGMSTTSLSNLPEVGGTVHLYTYLQVREDAMTLYGFTDPDEKALFLRLISVSGIGPKVALAALSTYAPEALIAAIVSQDDAMVARIPGVGKKTASRIVLELKDVFEMPDTVPAQAETGSLSPITQQVIDALLSMGFTSSEADLALQGAPTDSTETVLLQYALKRLGGV